MIKKCISKFSKKMSSADRAIIDTVLKTVDITASDNVLEVVDNISISEKGFFDKIGCSVDCLIKDNRKYRRLAKHNKNCKITYLSGDIESLNGGQFDFVLFYNSKKNIEFEIKKAISHTLSGGSIIALNTNNLITSDALNDIKYKLKMDTAVFNSGLFSLIIVTI